VRRNVDAEHFGKLNIDAAVAAEDSPDWFGDVGGRQRGRRHGVQRRGRHGASILIRVWTDRIMMSPAIRIREMESPPTP
jgi:hypothetical protein